MPKKKQELVALFDRQKNRTPIPMIDQGTNTDKDIDGVVKEDNLHRNEDANSGIII